MDALFCLLEEAEKTDLWRLYMAQIGEGVCGALGYKVAPYAEIIGIKKADTRTGDEIANDVMRKLERIAGKER